MNKIPICKRIETTIDGYNYMALLYNCIVSSTEKKIILDFSNTIWFQANLSSVLGAIIQKCRSLGYDIECINFNNSINNILTRNGFLSNVDGTRPSVKTDTIISFQQFGKTQDSTFNEYITQELLSKNDFPKHSKLLGERIGESIFEIFENARTHGRCDYIHACGQYFPNKNPSKVDMTIVDMGETIKLNVNNYFQFIDVEKHFDSAEAIEWAIQEGNTTKLDRTGGLGLSLLMNFIRLNNGIIQFVSSDGFLQLKNGDIKKQIIQYTFPGTIVNVEFNFDDNNFYRMKEESTISLYNIF